MKGVAFICVLLLVILGARVSVISGRLSVCDRVPIHTTAHRTPGNNGYNIIVKGLHQSGKYRPGETYTVVVKNTDEKKLFNKGMLGAMLVAVPQGAQDEKITVGNFSLPTDHVKEAKNCDHTVVVHHFLFTKKKIKVEWQAPEYGCVDLRATVISEEPTLWYKDDAGLTYTVCPEDLEDSQALGDASVVQPTPECCACGEARYNMVFKGIWSRQTHPKGFPSGRNALLLHWSNIVGATHTSDYFVWNYGEYAERGVKEVCEFGYSSKLESDMKQNSDKIYTVIKTSPMWRDVTGTRESMFSVNQKAHLLSLLTMVGPSPDWCIGIPSLSMCNANCTWMDKMVVDLYPWDAGTDDGIEYVNNAKIPTDPPQRIQRITHTDPKHPDSPFYDRHRPIKPLAQVTLTKVKEFCGDEDTSQSGENGVPSDEDLIDRMKKKMMMTKKLEMMKCQTTEWTKWTDCSNNCGAGMRQRSREMVNKNILPSMCNLELMDKEPCQGDCLEEPPRKVGREKLNNNFEVRHTYQLNLSDPCAITPWSDWSPCTAKLCGRGVRERWRMFLNKSALSMNCGKSIMEKDVCYGIIPDCRKAYMMKNFTAICSLPKYIGPCRGRFQRWYYDTRMQKCLPFQFGGCRGNDNRFERPEECRDKCEVHMRDFQNHNHINRAELTEMSEADMKKMMMSKKRMSGNGKEQLDDAKDKVNVTMRKKRKQMEKAKLRERRRQMKEKKRQMRQRNKGKASKEKLDCMVTQWTQWEECTAKCGSQYVERTRMIKVRAQNGGKKCPKKLQRRRKCRLPKCPRDCKVTGWRDWDSCSATCGPDAVRERSRKVMVKPKWGGMDCPSLTERQSCNLSACVDDKGMKEFLDAMQANPPH